MSDAPIDPMAAFGQGSQQQRPIPRPMKNQDAHNAALVIDMLFPGQVAMWQALVSLVMVFLGWYAVTVEVFFRHKFGERYFNLVKVGIAALIMGVVIQVAQFLNTYGGFIRIAISLALLRVLWWVFLAFALWHYVAIWRRNRRGETWHSMSYGISHLARLPFFQQFDDWVLYRFIEPGISLALAFVVYYLNGPLGVWLGIAGFALFARNNLAYMQQRDTLLDLIDERIQSQYLAAALSGAGKAQTLGWSVAKVPSALLREVQTVAEAAAADPPDFTAQVAERLRSASPSLAATADTLEPSRGEAVELPPMDDGPRFTAYQEEREPEPSRGERERDAA